MVRGDTNHGDGFALAQSKTDGGRYRSPSTMDYGPQLVIGYRWLDLFSFEIRYLIFEIPLLLLTTSSLRGKNDRSNLCEPRVPNRRTATPSFLRLAVTIIDYLFASLLPLTIDYRPWTIDLFSANLWHSSVRCSGFEVSKLGIRYSILEIRY